MNSLSQLNLQIPDLWEVRDVINKVKNVVLNYTEMEAKVHEATNNEAWGASSTLMLEIAQGTYNYQYFNEIMPTLYKRFTEKEASQWRQIYKALVLLEYLVKNGSERVVDDARSHISMIKIMRNFHHIDEKGKDQGINIRNRAKELADLLSDTDKIKSERKKARQNRNKYTGVGSESSFGMGSGSGGGFSNSGGSRFTGFGSDSLPTMSSGGSLGRGGFYDDDVTGKYDDNDADEDNDLRRPSSGSRSITSTTTTSATEKAAQSQRATAKEANLFDFGEEESSTGKKVDDDWGDFATGTIPNGNDDFDDFQSAPAKSNNVATASTAIKKNNLMDLLGDDAFSPAPVNNNTFISSSQPSLMDQSDNLFAVSTASDSTSRPMTPINTTGIATKHNSGNDNQAKSDLPGGIWSQASSFVSLDSLGKSNNTTKASSSNKPSMNAMKSTSVNAGWNNWASVNSSPQQKASTPKSPFDDLLS